MSNEDIVALIQEGNEALYADLWAQIERLASWKARRVINALEGCACNDYGGLEFDDFYQAGYLAMVEAVPTYRSDFGSFSTWFMYYLKSAYAELTGIRTQAQLKDPMKTAVSLCKPLKGKSEHEILSDVIVDPAGEEPLLNAEERAFRQQLHDALEKALNSMPDDLQAVIRQRYYEGLEIADIANRSGQSIQEIRQLEKNGMRRLRWPSCAEKLRPFYEFDYYSGGLGTFRSTGMSIQERYLIKKEKLYPNSRS